MGEEQSPALFADALKGYGLEVVEVDLTQVVRQEQQSGILWNATRLRQFDSGRRLLQPAEDKGFGVCRH